MISFKLYQTLPTLTTNQSKIKMKNNNRLKNRTEKTNDVILQLLLNKPYRLIAEKVKVSLSFVVKVNKSLEYIRLKTLIIKSIENEFKDWKMNKNE